jgi:hypothetical protein
VGWALVVLGYFQLAGCSRVDTSPVDESPGVQRAALDKGAPAGENAPELRAVGRVRRQLTGNTNAECSGVLVAPRVLLTAAHCIFTTAQGCDDVLPVPFHATVTFPDDPTVPATGTTIDIVAVSAHPDAYADRVSSCPTPAPPLTACPDPAVDPGAFELPSCNLVSQCFRAQTNLAATRGAHFEHDMALAYLQEAPAGITPLPMVVPAGWGKPSLGLFELPGAQAWLDEKPFVTLSGYGKGDKASISRDYGTVRIDYSSTTLDRPADCNGVHPDNEDVFLLGTLSTADNEPEVAEGDSGGPLLVGPGGVEDDMNPPSALPAGAGLAAQRYVAGVASTGGDAWSTYASLLEPQNAAWILARLQDIDGDGIKNDKDNCPSVINPGQENCNADAEQDRLGTTLGDACDPVPCPELKLKVSLDQRTSATLACGQLRSSSVVSDKVEVSPSGSHNPWTGREVVDVGAGEHAGDGLETYYRFCQLDRNRGIDCAVASGQRQHPMFLDAETGGIDNPWLRLSLSGLAVGANEFLTYPSAKVVRSWDYKSDRIRWLNEGKITLAAAPLPTPPQLPGQVVNGLNGVFGVRAGDAMTSLGSSYRPENGIHPSPAAEPYKAGANMARSYVDVAPQFTVSELGECVATCKTCKPECPACTRCLGASCNRDLGAWLAACPTCLKPFKDGLLGDDFRSIFRVPGSDLRASRTGGIFLLPDQLGRIGVLGPTGIVSKFSELMSKSLASTLLSNTERYVGPSEFSALSLAPPGTSAASVRAPGAVISTDATKLRDSVQVSAQGFALATDVCDPDVPSSPQAYRVLIPSGQSVSTLALATLGGQLKINDSVTVLTSSGSAAAVASLVGGTFIGPDARVGSTYADGSLELRNRARIEGVAKATGSITKLPDAVITGTASTNASLAPIDETAWTVKFPTTNLGNKSLEPDQSLALAPGAYGSVSVKSRAKLSLTRGVYYLSSLSVEPDAKLELDNRLGPIFIYVATSFTFRGQIVQLATTANVLYGVFGTSTVNLEAPFVGTVVAPNAKLSLAKVSQAHVGSFFGNSLEVMAGANVRLRAFSRSDCDRAGGCLGGGERCRSTRQPGDPAISLSSVPREGYVPVMSSALEALFIVGGRNAATHAELGTVVVHRFDSNTTFTLDLAGEQLHKVLAATVSYRDGSLWVLDQNGSLARLLRIDPLGRRVHVVWSGARAANTDGQWLSLDQGGDVLLSSSTLAGQHSVLRITSQPFAHGSERFQLVAQGSGTLVGAPLAEEGGLTYLLEGPGQTIVRSHPPSAAPVAVTSPSPWL